MVRFKNIKAGSWGCYFDDTSSLGALEINLYLHEGENYRTVLPIEIKVSDPKSCFDAAGEPFIKLNRNNIGIIQAIVDAAYEYGVVPKGYQSTDKEMEATKYHLEDMRKLVYKI